MMPHWESLSWMVYVGVAIGAWRYLPLTVVRLVAAFTRNRQRHRQCIEVLWLFGHKMAPPPCCVDPPTAPVVLADADTHARHRQAWTLLDRSRRSRRRVPG